MQQVTQAEEAGSNLAGITNQTPGSSQPGAFGNGSLIARHSTTHADVGVLRDVAILWGCNNQLVKGTDCGSSHVRQTEGFRLQSFWFIYDLTSEPSASASPWPTSIIHGQERDMISPLPAYEHARVHE